MNEDRKNKIICISAAVFFAAGFFLCVFLPKSDYLTSERRRAALRPEFSLDAVKSGRYMKGFEAWTVDTFPFREPFRTVQALTATRIFLRKDNNGLYEYEGMLANLGREVLVLDPAGEYKGICRGIDNKGQLLVELGDGSKKTVLSGEVSVRGIYGYV